MLSLSIYEIFYENKVLKGRAMKDWVLEICTNRTELYIELWSRLIEKGISLQTFHFSKEEEGLPEPGSAFDKTYINSFLTYKNWNRLFFFYKEGKTFGSLRGFLKKQESLPSLVHAHTLFSDGYLAYRLNKEKGIPYIVAVRSTDYAYFFKYRFYLRGLGRKILENASKIIFLSPATRKMFLDKYISEDRRPDLMAKSLVMPNGIDPVFFENPPEKPHKKPESNKIKLLSVATIMPQKNLLTACLAGQILIDGGYEIEYTIVGPVKNEDYAEKLRDFPFVKLVDKKSKKELINFYEANDLFILPSHVETFGLVYAEAMSRGLPVLYTEGQGFDGQFEEGRAGFALDDNDPAQIAKTIVRALEDYQARSRACIDLAKKFDWDKITEEYIEVYKDFL